MLTAPGTCLPDDVLLQLARGTVSGDEAASVHDHLDECPTCMATMLALVRGTAPAPVPTGGATAVPAIDGTRLGRFALRDQLGSGAMGTVFTAWDAQLDRTVAIKVLRAGRAGERDAARLLREAKAMAQVRHPNVVTVFEVGHDADVVFVAMELIKGRTLRAAAVDAVPPPPRAERLTWLGQIVDALAAIHGAGLIHRDLKPDNVFIDGSRAVVGDFGLAATADAVETPAARTSGTALGTRMAGTPAYMAPEQLYGLGLDPRADIFAFGVTAWEVLTGARPFAGKTVAAIDDSIRTGPTRTPAFDALPPALARVLERCVRYDRDARPRDAAELRAMLAPLLAPPARRGRLALAGAAVALLAGGTAATAMVMRSDDARPAAAGAALDPECAAPLPDAWAATRDAWLARAGDLGPAIRTRIDGIMAARSAAWIDSARTACASDPLTRAAWRMCHERVAAFETAALDLAVARRWPDDVTLLDSVAELLEPPATCLGTEAAEDAVAMNPLSPTARRAVVEGLTHLMRARLTRDLAPNQLELVEPHLAAAAVAAATASPSLLDGELAVVKARLQSDLPPAEWVARLQASVAEAERSGRASLVARAWLTVAGALYDTDGAPAAFDDAMRQAEWAIDRLRRPPRLRAAWLLRRAAWQAQHGDPAGARQTYAELLEVPGDDAMLVQARRTATVNSARLGNDDAATVAVLRRELAATIPTPINASSRIDMLAAIAQALGRMGDAAQAVAVARDAVALAQAALLGDDPMLISTLVVLADAERIAGDLAGALARLTDVLGRAQAALGAEGAEVGEIQASRASVLFQLERWDEGFAAARDAIAIGDARRGRASADSIFARAYLAAAMLDQGKVSDSLRYFDEARADAAAAGLERTPFWAQFLPAYASALDRGGRGPEALAGLEAAHATLVGKAFDPELVADVDFALATRLPRAQRSRARQLATAARGAASADVQAEIDAWLRRR